MFMLYRQVIYDNMEYLILKRNIPILLKNFEYTGYYYYYFFQSVYIADIILKTSLKRKSSVDVKESVFEQYDR